MKKTNKTYANYMLDKNNQLCFYTWQNSPAPDYTFKITLPQQLQILLEESTIAIKARNTKENKLLTKLWQSGKNYLIAFVNTNQKKYRFLYRVCKIQKSYLSDKIQNEHYKNLFYFNIVKQATPFAPNSFKNS